MKEISHIELQSIYINNFASQGSKVLTPEAWSVGCAEHGKGGKRETGVVDKPKETLPQSSDQH